MSFRFHNWKVYQDTRSFRKEIKEKIIPKIPRQERFELVSQLKRALDSVVLNIAEGAYRNSDKDFAHFLNQAQTSLNEVVSCLDLCYDDSHIVKEDLNYFTDKAENIIKQLSSFSKSLKSS